MKFLGVKIPDASDLMEWLASMDLRAAFSDRLIFELSPSEFSQDSFDLYCRYQVGRHGDKLEDLTPARYTSFLVDSPILRQCPNLGSFHHRWFLDGNLIAVGVLDILPACISSVYFFHDPSLSSLSLGTISALFEIAIVKSMSLSHPELRYYYLGYYIEGCSKMQYKAGFGPAQILHPGRMAWIPFDQAQATLICSDH